MNKLKNISEKNYEYHQYNDYVFKQTVQKHINGVLKVLKIPYTVNNIILSELTSYSPKIHRLDFAGEAIKNGEDICFVLECQSQLPSEEDIERFFQYVSSLLVLKKRKVELYILCTVEVPYDKKEYVLNDDCVYVMHVVSLKNIKANDIFKRIERKKYNQINEEDIASLQLIVYTDYDETPKEILKKAFKIVKKIEIDDINEKQAMIYILEVLSANMLDEKDYMDIMEETEMILNPRERYIINQIKEEDKKEYEQQLKNEIKQHNKKLKNEKKQHNQELKNEKIEIAKKLIKEKLSTEKISTITGLTIKEIQNITK